jgi:hypothetical protein
MKRFWALFVLSCRPHRSGRGTELLNGFLSAYLTTISEIYPICAVFVDTKAICKRVTAVCMSVRPPGQCVGTLAACSDLMSLTWQYSPVMDTCRAGQEVAVIPHTAALKMVWHLGSLQHRFTTTPDSIAPPTAAARLTAFQAMVKCQRLR